MAIVEEPKYNMPSEENTRFQIDYPPLMVIIVLLVAAMFGGLLGSGAAYLITTAQGTDLASVLESLREESTFAGRNTIRHVNLVSHFMAFTFPVLLVAIMMYRRDWYRFLQLDRAPSMGMALLGCVFMFGIFPVAQLALWLNEQIPLPNWASQLENNASGMLKSLMQMDSPWEFLFNLLVMAVLPAVGEELMFRGVIQQKLQKIVRNGHGAIWITAIIFSAVHFQFQGFLARMLLGAGLGYLFYWTRNLWIPIIAHFFINSIQISAQYFFSEQVESMQAEADKTDQIPWVGALFGILLLFVFGRMIYQQSFTDMHPDNQPYEKQ